MFCILGSLHFKWHKSYSEAHTGVLEGFMRSKVEHLESGSQGFITAAVSLLLSIFHLYWSLSGFFSAVGWRLSVASDWHSESFPSLVKSTFLPICIAVPGKNCDWLWLGHTCPPSCCLGDGAIWLTAHKTIEHTGVEMERRGVG